MDINSPLGRRKFATAAAQQRVLTVPDEEETSQDFVVKQQTFVEPSSSVAQSEFNNIEHIQQARKSRLEALNKLPPLVKERIQLLTGTGRITDMAEVDGVVFSLRSLKSHEIREVVELAGGAKNPYDGLFESRNQTLARAIYAIDGQPTHLFFGTNDVGVIAWIIDEMDDHLTKTLHDKYLAMIGKRKLSVTTEEEAKEVADQIKK